MRAWVCARGCVSFVIGNYAYVGLGSTASELAAQIYRYDPVANSWQSATVFPGSQRAGATGLTVDGKAYVVGGIGAGSSWLKDVWEYDPVAGSWLREPDLPIAVRLNAVGFSDSANAFYGFGNGTSPSGYTDLWKFRP